VADDWVMNAFGLTAIHFGSSTVGVLDRTKIGKPEGTCETQLSHPASQNRHRLQITNLIYVTYATVVKCTIAADTVYIIKKGECGNWTRTHQMFQKKGNLLMRFNQLYQQQKILLIWSWIHLGLSAIHIHQ
jgi:hypothetical protein